MASQEQFVAEDDIVNVFKVLQETLQFVILTQYEKCNVCTNRGLKMYCLLWVLQITFSILHCPPHIFLAGEWGQCLAADAANQSSLISDALCCQWRRDTEECLGSRTPAYNLCLCKTISQPITLFYINVYFFSIVTVAINIKERPLNLYD